MKGSVEIEVAYLLELLDVYGQRSIPHVDRYEVQEASDAETFLVVAIRHKAYDEKKVEEPSFVLCECVTKSAAIALAGALEGEK